MVFTIVFLVLFLILIFYGFNTYNQFISSRNATELAWSNVEVELKRRLDLIGNLVETVKGYAAHEKKTLENVIAARSLASTSTGPTGASASEGIITQSLKSLFALAEAYPDLKANTNFLDLQKQLVETESRIAERRLAYNQTAKIYRDLCQSFPSLIIASIFSFQPLPFFDVPDELVKNSPEVSFNEQQSTNN